MAEQELKSIKVLEIETEPHVHDIAKKTASHCIMCKALQMTPEEEEGVNMIIELQGMAEIKESIELALAGWRAMSPKNRERTKAAFQSLFNKEEVAEFS